MLVVDDERVTPVYLISLLGSVSRYEQSFPGFSAGRGVDPAGDAPGDSIGYPCTRASGESSTTKHRLLHTSGPHPIPPPNDPVRVGKRVKVRHLSCRVSMTFRVVRSNQYNQDIGLIHSTNGNHLESLNEGSSIDHQVTIHLHAQNITMFPTNETWYFASQMLVSSSGGLILILTAQSTRNDFRIHSDY
ncbi:hypothetical protein F511_39706 [Dorcoceras hygrometricum]|uniref:Uncharacterized protein n=1 Tax=Dorcoceras hygrometricum TaxID=472368 RepID=A0A2Z7BBS8_9LAMI|nr:hypothetical protein F511_39706 [Dorcoceras hygrometricum]